MRVDGNRMWGLVVLCCVVGAFHCGVRIALCCFVLCCFVGAGIVDSLSITGILSSVQDTSPLITE